MGERKWNWRAKSMGLVLAGAVVAVVILAGVPAATLAASPNDEETPVAAASQRWATRLERLFKREKAVLGQEDKRLAQAAKVEERLAARIEALKARGENTAELESGLADFKADVSEARSYHDTAEATLDAHAGFDAAGKVVNRAKARKTVTAAGTAEHKFRQAIRKAGREVVKAIRKYRQEHRPAPTSAGTPR